MLVHWGTFKQDNYFSDAYKQTKNKQNNATKNITFFCHGVNHKIITNKVVIPVIWFFQSSFYNPSLTFVPLV